MKRGLHASEILERLLAKTGEWYVVIAITFSQIAASATMVIGFISELLNAEYAPEVVTKLNRFEGVGIPLVIALLIAIALILSRSIYTSLRLRSQKPELFRNKDNMDAWRASHTLIWKVAVISAFLSFGLVVIPRLILLKSLDVVNQDQVIFSLIAGIVSSLAYIPMSTVILDSLLVPVRQIFLPKEFSKQLSGLGNFKILHKTLVITFFSLFITTLLIAPIGYHQITRILNSEEDSYRVLVDLRIQTIAVSGLAILFASGLTYLFARSVSDPLAKLMDSFTKVENGDLTTRAPVVSSDEISKMAVYFNRMVARLQELQSNLENKVEERTSQLKAINEVGRVATSILDPDELLMRVAELISAEFGYYYSALYLIDHTGQWCTLRAATGEAGRVLLASKHQVEINHTNIIGKAIQTRQAQILNYPGEKNVRHTNPLLPYTRSEITLPLIVRDQILGALDVHSTQEAAFNDQDIETLQNMANQVAISLDNARLFQETRQRLNELGNIQKQYLQEAWIDSSLPKGEISLAIGDYIEGDKDNLTEFPIKLRDQIIGQLFLGKDEALSTEDKYWVQSIAYQAALALENARLLEESQSAVMRDKFVSEITNKIWSATSVDGVLQTTVRELGQILDASEATIEIGIDEN